MLTDIPAQKDASSLSSSGEAEDMRLPEALTQQLGLDALSAPCSTADAARSAHARPHAHKAADSDGRWCLHGPEAALLSGHGWQHAALPCVMGLLL